jgi:NADH-quinone oxidoreductase subunit A
MPGSYLPVLLLFIVVGGMAGLILYLARLIGPRNMSGSKAEPFESGIPAAVPHRGPLSIKFYIVAMIFIIFDIEVVFLYPWAVLFRKLGLFGLVEMAIFIGILAIGLAYAWRKGGLEWD